ncbi:MAG: hypothetical protein C4523_20300 [Myxococcales bacterium]|nr:MAG: hypothetical protein C4523_20300 [Myxococcales bacterium]
MACASPSPSEQTSDGDSEADDSLVIPAVEDGVCVISEGEEYPEFLQRIGCAADFGALASEPINSTLPGARSVKIVLDQADENALYFQNSVLYQVHYEFASSHLSGDGLPIVPQLSEFNTTEYYSPERRFILGAVTHYEGPGIWALEISPYDTASAPMIATLYEATASAAFFGPGLFFHPTSEAVAAEAANLPAGIPAITTDDIYAEIDYQPLTLAVGIGQLIFAKAADLGAQYLSFTSIVVLDEAPNDISVVQGLITEEFQTPLSHVNVLSQNRHTPNMGLRNALTDPTLLALEGKLVELTVASTDWSIREVSREEAEAFWEAKKPEAVTLPALDLSVKDIVDIEEATPEPEADETLRDKIATAVQAYGGKAAHYSVLVRTDDAPIRKALAVPVYYYWQFMDQNGFFDRLDSLLADEPFASDYATRDQKLAELRDEMMASPLDEEFQTLLKARIAAMFPTDGKKLRFRTSTNSEDLDGFPCAGCYESHTGDPYVWESVLDAIRETYASAWLFRSFEERTYYGVDHKTVGMGLIVHQNFPDEEANGVAVTANPFDASGLDPAFYVNVQYGGDVEVVAPPPGVTSDQFLYYFSEPGQPVTYLSRSNLVCEGDTVLGVTQIHQLGLALAAIHERFSPAYGPASGNGGWYAMDVEFKFDDAEKPDESPTLYIKQARPYPGRGE